MIAHSLHGFFVYIAIVIALVVFARALAPLLRSVGLVVALIGAAVGLVAAAVALCAVIFARVAGWAGWNHSAQPLNVSGHTASLGVAMVAPAATLAGALIVIVLFVRRRGKPD